MYNFGFIEIKSMSHWRCRLSRGVLYWFRHFVSSANIKMSADEASDGRSFTYIMNIVMDQEYYLEARQIPQAKGQMTLLKVIHIVGE